MGRGEHRARAPRGRVYRGHIGASDGTLGGPREPGRNKILLHTSELEEKDGGEKVHGADRGNLKYWRQWTKAAAKRGRKEREVRAASRWKHGSANVLPQPPNASKAQQKVETQKIQKENVSDVEYWENG